MELNTYSEPKLYCGTYAKYAAGSIDGRWVDLNNSDPELFDAECRQIHSSEHDPEFMFQDCEGLPDTLYSECGTHPQLFDWLALDDDQRQLSAFLMDSVNWSPDDAINAAEDGVVQLYTGRLDFFALDQIEAFYTYDLPEHLIDAEAYCRDLICNGDVSLVMPETDAPSERWINADHATWLIGANRND